MPTIELTAESIKSLVPPENGKCDWYDETVTGFLCELRASGGMTYYLKYRDPNGTLRQYKIGNSKDLSFEKAKATAQKLRARVILGESPMEARIVKRATPTFGEFVQERYLPFIMGSKKSWQSDESLLRLHLLPKLARMSMDTISKADIIAIHHGRRAAGAAKGSANRLLVLLRYIYNCAIRWEIPGITKNPTAGISLFEDPPTKDRFLTKEEAQRLYQAVQSSRQPMLQYIVPMLLLTGARRREVLDAKWEDFDIPRRSWRIPITKSGKPRHVPLSAGALRILENVPRFPGCPYVFPNHRTLKPMASGFVGWDNARRKAGLADVRLHDLRHSAASAMAAQNVSLFTIMQVLGHSQIRTTTRYSHLANETLVNAVDVIANTTGFGIAEEKETNGVVLEGEMQKVPAIIEPLQAKVIEVEKLAA